ncbi:Uncharacterised protein [uncultured archaeon]|nr:Uncharacterised protein [uncultured archaeon]
MKMEIIKRLTEYLSKRQEEARQLERDYQRAYQRCFEGTPEQVALRLGAWDYVHRTTRPSIERRCF